jgi:O-antigen/teichoic acid export membrane protein
MTSTSARIPSDEVAAVGTDEVGRRRPGPARFAAAWGAALRSLRGNVGDGLAMSAAAGGAAVVGLVSWIVAARALTPAELGTATAFVSAFLLIAGVTELNLGVGLLRWLPGAGAATGRLLLRSLATVAALAAVVALCYLAVPGSSVILDAVVGPGAPPVQRLVSVAVFVAAAGLYALFQLQDFVLVGLRRAWWAPARTALFAIGRLGILLVAGASLTTTGVVISWLVPTAACVVLVALQSWVVSRRVAADGPAGALPGRREVLTFLGPAYLGQMAQSILFNQIPLLIVFRFGPEQGAGFFLVWQAVTVVDVLAQYFTSSLSAGVAREPERAAELSRAVRRQLLLFVVPALAVGALIAEPVLALFGPAYATEAWVLRLMLLGLCLRLLVVHRLGEHQSLGRGFRFGRLAVVNTALVLGVAFAVPVTAENPLLDFAIGFIAVQLANAVIVTLRRRSATNGALIRRHRKGRTGPVEQATENGA